jgi:hypothetical protein
MTKKGRILPYLPPTRLGFIAELELPQNQRCRYARYALAQAYLLAILTQLVQTALRY